MSRFVAINLTGLQAPDVVETVSFEAILQEMKNDVVSRLDTLGIDYDVAMLESDPVVKVLEVAAYREVLLRARVNTAARAVMLAYSQQKDLEHLGVYYGVERQLVQAATATSPAIYEDDARFRERIQLAPEALSTAGPEGAYRFHAMTIDPNIKSVQVYSPRPGEVHVLPLVKTGNGLPSSDLLSKIRVRLAQEDIRPLTDMITVRGPTTIPYDISISLSINEGPDISVVRQAAENSVRKYISDRQIVGTSIYRSGLIAAAHVAGVERVTLLSPNIDILAREDELPMAITIAVTA